MVDKKIVFQFKEQTLELHSEGYIISSKEQLLAIVDRNALPFFTKACEEDPHNYLHWLNKCHALMMHYRYIEASEALKEALALDTQGILDLVTVAYDTNLLPDELKALMLKNKGIALRKQGNTEEAIKTLDKARSLMNISSELMALILNIKGVALCFEYNYEKAEKTFEQALALEGLSILGKILILNNKRIGFDLQKNKKESCRAHEFKKSLIALSKNSLDLDEKYDMSLCLQQQYDNGMTPNLREAKDELNKKRVSRQATRQVFNGFDDQSFIPQEIQELILEHVDDKRNKTLDRDPQPNMFDQLREEMLNCLSLLMYLFRLLFQLVRNDNENKDEKEHVNDLNTEDDHSQSLYFKMRP